jgi:hypothetical protein
MCPGEWPYDCVECAIDRATAACDGSRDSSGLTCSKQVPDAQPSLAGSITSSRHQRWIE